MKHYFQTWTSGFDVPESFLDLQEKSTTEIDAYSELQKLLFEPNLYSSTLWSNCNNMCENDVFLPETIIEEAPQFSVDDVSSSPSG